MADTGKQHKRWSDAELKAATDAYLYMLQLEQNRIPFSVSEQSDMLQSAPLNQRNEASIRYRMRNISFVMQEINLPTLKAFSAAPQVGKNVAEIIRRHLEDRSDVLERIREQQQLGQPQNTSKVDDVLNGLESLGEKIEQLRSSKVAGIGHNNPPDDMSLTSDEINNVVEAIDAIKANITAAEKDYDLIRASAKKIANLGTQVFVWSGQRMTDFAKSAAITAGGGFGLWLSGLGETIVSTLGETLRLFLPHLF